MCLRAKITFVRICSYRYRCPSGMPAKILQWFALDPEPPPRYQGQCNATFGEKTFYNFLRLIR